MSAFSRTVRLTATGLNWLTAKLAKWPQVEITGTPVTVEDEDETGNETVLFDTAVSLNAPTVPGHTFLCRIEHLGDEGNVIYRVAGEEKAAYRTAKPFCVHCNTTRRRNDTFILREDASGAEKQIGRNCLAEYCRSPEAAADLLHWADCIDRVLSACSEAEEDFGRSRSGEETFTPRLVIAWSLAFGGKWVSASQARETGETASAWELLNDLRECRYNKDRRFWESRDGQRVQATQELANKLAEEEGGRVDAVLTWIDTLTAKGDSLSDYESNLCTLKRVGFVTAKQWSFFCSAHRAFLRAEHVARGEAEAKAAAARGPVGEHVGTIGQRIEFPKVNCTDKKSLGVGEFGERFLVKFTTAEGHSLTWFASGDNDFEAGKEYDITATVKDHDEWRGTRSTVVQRVKEGVKPPKAPKKPKASKKESV